MSNERRWITIEDAAQRLSCTKQTVRRRIAAGDLAAYRLGARAIRLDADQVDGLLTPIPTARKVG